MAKTVTHPQPIVAGREKHLADLRARCLDDPEDRQAWLALVKAYDETGETDRDGGQYDQALEWFHQAVGIYERLDDQALEWYHISFDGCQEDPDPAQAGNFPVRIVTMFKTANPEVVRLENVSGEVVDLTGWHMCSITGNQEHTGLGGTIGPGEGRDFAHTGSGW